MGSEMCIRDSLEWAQTVGIVLLLGLMALALGNDIWRVVTGQFG